MCAVQLLMENELLKAEIAGLKNGNGKAVELLAADLALQEDDASLPASPTPACASRSPAFAPASPQPAHTGATRLGEVD